MSNKKLTVMPIVIKPIGSLQEPSKLYISRALLKTA